MDDLQSSEEVKLAVVGEREMSLQGIIAARNHVIFGTTFVVDEIKQIIQESVESVLGTVAYQNNKVNQWTSNIVEQCLNQLTKLGKPFKYIVTSVIMQKNGAGLHTASSCYWDNSTDGSCTIRWENKTMYCIVTVFGLAI